jgi:hypothetical protein
VLAKEHVTADSGFHSQAVLAAVERTGANAYIADRDYRRRDPAFAGAGRHKKRDQKERALERRKQRRELPQRQKLLSVEDFIYDEAKVLLDLPCGPQAVSQGQAPTV